VTFPVIEQAVPVLRTRDAEATLVWYARLGFVKEWEHRFEPGFPLFLSIIRGDLRLFLSEHHGDAVPGTVAYLRLRDVDAAAAAVGSKAETMEWGTREFQVHDPDGNRLRIGWPVSEVELS